MRNKFFALGLQEHRLWGTLFIPMIIRKNSGEVFYSPDQTVFKSETDQNFLNLSHTEKEVVRIIEEYNDQNLFKLFSKHKNIKEFQEKISPENIENFIRPYVEKRLARVFSIIRGTTIHVFHREKSRSNIFEEDFLNISMHDCYPVFNFTKYDEGTAYSLKLKNQGGKLILKDRYYEVICNLPAIIRLDNEIHFIQKIEGKKLKPFFSRDHILVPRQTEKQYFRSFILNMVRDYEVEARGFRIDLISPPRKVVLSMERGIRNNAVMVLRFFYGKKVIMANSTQNTFVDFFTENDNFRYEKYFRDPEFEDEYHDQLNSLSLHSFDQVNYELKESFNLGYEEQLYSLIEWTNRNYNDLVDSGFIIEQKKAEKTYFISGFNLDMQTKLEKDWFDIYAVVELGEFKISFLSFRKHILSNTREFELPDGTVFILPAEWFTRFRDLFEFGKTEGDKIRLHKQHFSILEKAEQQKSKQIFSNLEKLNARTELPSVQLPKDLAANLRPYQVEGYTWLTYLQQLNLGGCLADDMGLGKTLQAICLLLKNKESYIADPGEPGASIQPDLFSKVESRFTSLIVVPASLVHNWINEMNRFAPSFRKLAYVGSQRGGYISKLSEYDIVISTYHTIRQDIEKISGFRFHYVILDESQVIKNPSSKIYKAVQHLNSEYRVALTGTPVENSLTDLWAQMNFINKGLLGSLNFFRREYVTPIEKKNDLTREEKLKKLINPFILRRTKEEVAKDLPEMTEQVIYCNMNEEQRKFYEEEKSSIRNSVFLKIEEKGIEKSAMIVLRGLTRLRQISNHPKLVDENYRDGSGKFDEIIRNLLSVVSEGHKALVFSSFVKHLEIIREELLENKIEHTLLTGESVKRENIVKAFQDNIDCRIFLISLKAGGVGLNLTAADYVFILDPWWNPASEDQAVNRAHRIGQDKNVFVYRFISVNSIEEKIQMLQQRKSRLAENFVTSNNPLRDVSKEELKDLFE